MALWLMSPAAQRLTGLFVPVDGGNHVRGLFSYWDKMVEGGAISRPPTA